MLRLFGSVLLYSEQVKELLQPYGLLKAFNLVMDKHTGNSKVWQACYATSFPKPSVGAGSCYSCQCSSKQTFHLLNVNIFMICRTLLVLICLVFSSAHILSLM